MNGSAVVKATLIGLLAMFALGMLAGLLLGSGTMLPSSDALLNGQWTGAALSLIIVNLLAYVIVGALYGWFARREGTPVDAGNGALGGFVSGALLGIVNGVAGILLGGSTQGATGATLAMGVVLGMILAGIIGGIPAAIGGAIYGAMHRDEVMA